MKTFHFRTKRGVLIAIKASEDSLAKRLKIDNDGQSYINKKWGDRTERLYLDGGPSARQRTDGNWKEPLLSTAMGVNPKQIPAAVAAAKRHGVSVDFHPKTGQAILTSRSQRKKLAQSIGFRDFSGGYGDP